MQLLNKLSQLSSTVLKQTPPAQHHKVLFIFQKTFILLFTTHHSLELYEYSVFFFKHNLREGLLQFAILPLGTSCPQLL